MFERGLYEIMMWASTEHKGSGDEQKLGFKEVLE